MRTTSPGTQLGTLTAIPSRVETRGHESEAWFAKRAWWSRSCRCPGRGQRAADARPCPSRRVVCLALFSASGPASPSEPHSCGGRASGLPRRCRRSECGISYGRGRSWFLEGRSSRPLKTCDSPLASRPRKRGQSSCPSDRAADAESGNGQSDGAADERTAVVVRFDARRRRRVERRGERSARTADRASERQLPLRFSSAWHSLQDRPCAGTRNSPQSV